MSLSRSLVYGLPNLEEVLIARAEARAHLWAEYMLGLPQAVDELWEWALTRGLVSSLGVWRSPDNPLRSVPTVAG
jgi:hypothetical protein